MTAAMLVGTARTVFLGHKCGRPLLRKGSAALGLAIVAISLLLVLAGLPLLAAQDAAPCAGPSCGWSQLGPETAAGLRQLGISLEAWAVYWASLNLVFVVAWAGVAAVLAVRRPDEPVALLGCVMLAAFSSTFNEAAEVLRNNATVWSGLLQVWSMLGSAALMVFFYLFPDGHFVPRWTRWPAGAWVGLCAVAYASPPGSVVNQNGPVFLPLTIAFFLSILAAQGYRYWRVASAVQRHQTKWVVAGFAAAFGSFYVLVGLVLPRTLAAGPGSALAHLAGETALPLTQLLIPTSIVIAMLRYRLWDIDVLLSRALVYGGLTAGVVALYVLVVGYLGAVFHTTDNLAVSLVATGVVAVIFQPARQRLQQAVNHLVYGERDEPYTVLSRLGQRLETALIPQAVPATVVGTIRDALRLPYVALVLNDGGADRAVAEVGQPAAGVLRVPLTCQTEALGELRLAPRAPGEPWSAADRRLLDDLARQVGVAVHGLRTLADLQRSRERLVLAREEERRRLRGDLHDDLAPALAALALHADAAGELLARDPAAAARLVSSLQTALRASVAEVRRLAYDLRPPALDDLGLVEAIRERADQFSRGTGGSRTEVRVTVIDDLPALPAAIEVAAYRVVQEALMNVHRHAAASCCEVRLAAVDGLLEVEVSDDGVGLPEAYQPGIGLRSMHERAAELGGWCHIGRLAPRGTHVVARLPLAAS